VSVDPAQPFSAAPPLSRFIGMNIRPQRSAVAGKFALLALSAAAGGTASAQAPLLDFEILYEINGDSQGDLLGASTAGVGDVNGDGVGDFVVGIQREDPSGIANAGTARVFSGVDGVVLYTFEGITQGGFFGNDVRGAGDVNDDGTPDIIVGAIFDDRGGLNRSGSATVFSGADGSVLHLFEGTEIQGLMGRAVDGAGDVNGDGHADLIVGVTDDRNGTDSGSIRVFSGADGSLLYDILGDAAFDSMGASVAGLGDLDGDGFDDFAAGARNASIGLLKTGQVRVFSGQTGAVLFTHNGATANAIMHMVNSAGDVNGDSTPDYLVGSPGADVAAVYSGADGTALYSFSGNSAGDGFGSRLAGIGDVDHDGSADVIIAAPADDRNGPAAGSVTVYSGADGSVLLTLDGDPGDQLGSGVGGLGNVNGDACDDFIVGAFFDDNIFTNSGSAKILVLSGTQCALDVTAPVVTITAPAAGLVVGALSVLLEASVVDDSPSDATTTPATTTESFPAGGGSLSVVIDLLDEGDNDLVVSAVDAAGNIGGTAVTVLRDTIAPSITLTSPLAGTVLGSTPAVITLQVDDATATDVTFGANVLAAPRGGGTLAGSVDLVEGQNTITVNAVDEAGNQTSLDVTLMLDLTAPLVTIDGPADAECFGVGEELVVVTATVDDLSATTIVSNSAGMAPSLPAGGGVLAGTVTLVEGLNELTVAATDATARTSTAAVSVLLDTTGPAATLDSLDPLIPVVGDVDLGAIVADVLPGTGVASVEFSVDGNSIIILAVGPYETVYDTTLLTDGPHTFSVLATDGKGNTSQSDVTVTVDNLAPAVAFTSPVDGDFVMGTIPVEVTSSDAGAGLIEVTVRAGGQTLTLDPSVQFAIPQMSALLSGAQDTIPLPDGLLVLEATATDAAGNVTTTQISVNIDNTAPQKFLASPSDGASVAGTIDVVADGVDANLALIEIYIDNVLVGTSTTAPLIVSFDTTTILDGSATVTAIAYDSAGNVSNCSADITVDNIEFKLTPQSVSLGRANKHVQAMLKGPNVADLLPTEDYQIELHVAGASPIPALTGWTGDDNVSVDGDNANLKIRFERGSLASAISAGIVAGMIDPGLRKVEVALVVDGRVIGTDLIKVNKKRK